MDSLESLHARLRLDPVAHLGRKSVRLINSYELGYEMGRARWGHPPLKSELSGDDFQQWAEQKFHWTAEMGCRQNIFSFALLFSVDEQSAFDTYFSLREAARRGLGSDAAAAEEDCFQPPKDGLLEFIRSEQFRSRPALYIGQPSLDALWALCSGFVWAEKDLGVECSGAQLFTNGFQTWIEARFPFSKGVSWNRTLDFLALSDPGRAWSSFYDALDAFAAGCNPDALSKTGEQMLQGITRQILASNPNASAEEIAEKFRETVKNICPI